MTPEKVPANNPNRQFPIGDIDIDERKRKKINEWFEKIDDMDNKQYWGHIRINNVPNALDGELAIITYAAAMSVCKSWDESRENSVPAAQVGYRLFTAFNQQNHLLPGVRSDFTPQLRQMRLQQQHLAPEFAQFAWEGIETYPNLYWVYDRLLDLGRIRYALDNTTTRQHFMAGLALPYALTWASRLEGYTPQFSGIKDKKFNPDEDFKEYLVN